ncbi:carbon-nitrogen hydrolase family protein [Roseovarius sp. SYSU LYC5161]|uniref:carbon-nitrogen hydrolase family protein n=1 Tax=Roseovarius halophilus (ex Wu et al. 2025) TaxID=3376060 RepID=UPI00399BE07A
MKIATAAYPMEPLENWAAYAAKLEAWVADAAGHGAELLVFPEYGAMELATLAGPEAAADPERSMRAVSDRISAADALHSDLAARYDVHICAASAPIFDAALGARPVNRARLFAPGGGCGVQDKQIMTRFERDPVDIVPGGPLRLFDTALGRIGILICYDSEFPLLGRALAEADVILVPSCTEALSGYWRVRIGAMARALETQCVTAMASLVGEARWTELADVNTGTGGVFGPPDTGFPASGVLAEGRFDVPGWTYAEIDRAAVAHVRADGGVLNRRHWQEQAGRDGDATTERLR